MTESYAITRYELAAALLPPKWQRVVRTLPDWQKVQAEELRLRAGHPITVLLPEGEQWIQGQMQEVTPQDLEQLCDLVTSYSRYAVTDQMAQGYLTAPGGFRVGICGSAVMQERNCCNIRHISSISIRIAKESVGISDKILPQLVRNNSFCSTVIVASPGSGKTTLLRDLIRNLSNGTADHSACRVSVVDERGEIAGMYHGLPQLGVGCHTDILEGAPKVIGIPILLRSANPQVIAVDEITAREDLQVMMQAANCGVKLLATVHAADLEELKRKPLFAKLLGLQVFEKAVIITSEAGERRYHVEALL